jgi:hypothetical protein
MKEEIFMQNYFCLSMSQKELTQYLPQDERGKDLGRNDVLQLVLN